MNPISRWLPPDLSKHGFAIDSLIWYVHLVMIALFVGWGIYFIYCLARFRQGGGRKASYEPAKGKIAKSVEVAVIIAEAVLLVALSMPAWASWKHDFPDRHHAITVRVVGEQFAWNIHYPGKDGVFGRTDPKLMNNTGNSLGIDMTDRHAKDDIITLNEFHIPVRTPVVVELTSKDVIHSFTINVLRVKQDAIPGMMIPIHFEAQDQGDRPDHRYDISCAQLCGLGHYRMQGFVYIDTPEQYEQWVKEKQSDLGVNQ